MIQITPQMRVLVAIEPVDGRKGIDSLARLCQEKLAEGVEILLANCLAHGRRQFVEVAANFPAECRYVLETLGEV
jgi:predicted metal-binding protein